MVYPLPAIIIQLILLLLGSAVQARVYHGRGEMNRRRSIEYSFALELLTICLGWTTFFTAYDFLPPNLQQGIRYFILRGVWMADLNPALLILIPLIFFLALEIKMLAVRILDFWLSYTGELLEGEELPIAFEEDKPGTTQFVQTRIQVFVNRYQRLQQSLTQEVIFLGHTGSSIACAAAFGIQAAVVNWFRAPLS